MSSLRTYSDIIYGPVHSRRLGLSLGINLLPFGRKVCPFNCLYCECGTTTDSPEHTHDTYETLTAFPTVEEVHQAVATALQTHSGINAITFSGHGEPTLHPHFPDIVAVVLELRNTYQQQANLAVFSSSVLIMQPRPRAGIDLCDLCILKLDAGDNETFHAINRPSQNLHIEQIIYALARMPSIIIQTCLVDGPVQNIRGDPWESLIHAIYTIAPTYIQLYSIDRPTAVDWVQRVSPEILQQRASEMQARTNVPVEAY